jgi:hypothetical protein
VEHGASRKAAAAHDQKDAVAGLDPHVFAGMLDLLATGAIDLDDEKAPLPRRLPRPRWPRSARPCRAGHHFQVQPEIVQLALYIAHRAVFHRRAGGG